MAERDPQAFFHRDVFFFFFQLKTRRAPSPWVTGLAGILTEGSCILMPLLWLLCASSGCVGSAIICALRIQVEMGSGLIGWVCCVSLAHLTELLNGNFQWGNWITAESSYQVIHVQNSSHCINKSHRSTVHVSLKIFIFNWRIVALQYCIDFCHTTMWISHKYIYVPSLLNLPPTTLRHLTLLDHRRVPGWAPRVHSNFPLAICFTCDNVYISMLLSQFVPPSSYPIVSTSLFCISVSLFLPWK